MAKVTICSTGVYLDSHDLSIFRKTHRHGVSPYQKRFFHPVDGQWGQKRRWDAKLG